MAKHTSSGANLFILGIYNNGYHIRLQDMTHDGPKAFTGEWLHVAVTGYREDANPTVITRMSLFLNGEHVEDFSFLNRFMGDVSGGQPWTIGQDWDGSTRTDFFDGAIDDVRIYDTALSIAEIRALVDGYSGTCQVFPGQQPTVEFAASTGVCREVVLTAGAYHAAISFPAAT